MRPILVAIGTCFLVLLGLSFRPGDDPIERIENLTYAEAQRYLEARYLIGGGELKLCEDNFKLIPQRDSLLELVSVVTAEILWSTGEEDESQKIYPYIDVDLYADGDSPWGAFSSPSVKERVLPAFEEAKRRISANLKKEG